MGLLTGIAFWIMCGIMWLMATPILYTVINGMGLSGVELFLMNLVPWAVLIAIIGRIVVVLRTGGEPA